jgi:eukaryotic-like serine/threonine-protein kinase
VTAAAAPSCPSAGELAGFVAGELPAEAARALEVHLDDCDSCRRGVSALVGAEHDEGSDTLPATPVPVGDDGPALAAGQRVGRFTLVRKLGSGAMGEVWAAHDAVLEREIALKLSLPHRELPDEALAARMRREAQAMARLNHPNVVAIYDLGDAGERAFCAMELVDGITLRAWLATRRPWRVVLPVLLAAGRGLAAAHAAGLVHRDFKPENVLVARDGRVLVTDFGLALLDKPHTAPAGGELAEGTLTTAGALIGTPAYMAPEQLDGGRVDALGDQFAFSVVVHEALFGARPFSGATIAELRAAIRAGVPKRADLRGVPPRVVRALARGLADDPAARWPTLGPLLGELFAASRPRRRWLIASGVAAVAAAGAAATVILTRTDPAAAAAAERSAAEQRIARAWSPTRRAELHTAFARSGYPLAASREAELAAALDAYRAAWLAERLDAWTATNVRGEQSVERLDRELACFERLADQLDAFVTLLAHPQPVEVGRAPDLAYKLEAAASCKTPREPGAPSTPAGHALERGLRELEMLQVLGRHADALARADALVRDADAAGDPGLRARAHHDRAITRANTARFTEAAAELRAAVQDAATARDHYLVAAIWIRLISIEALNLGHASAAAELEQVARAAVAQAGDDPRQLGDLEFDLGLAAFARGDLAAARAHLETSRARRVAFFGTEHPVVASTESNLGAMQMHLGQLDDAQRTLDHALAVTTAKLGPDHPLAAQIALNLAAVATRRLDWPTAERELRTVIRVDTAVFPNGHPELVRAQVLLARALREQKRYDDAAAAIAAAHREADRVPALGPERAKIGLAEAQLAEARGDYTAAVQAAQPAAAAIRADPTTTAMERAYALGELARMVAYRDPRGALPIYDQSLELHVGQPSREESADAEILTELAQVALRAHRPAAALKWFDRMPKAAAKLEDLRAQLR